MKIFQVRYNENRYCYYKAEKRELFNEKTIVYRDYLECLEDRDRIEGFESSHIAKSLIKYFNQSK